jgi:hypothetical protein
MSQIDKVNYIVHLFWFVILFLMLYMFLFYLFIPVFFQSINIRMFFYFYLIKTNNVYNNFIIFLVNFSYNLKFFELYTSISRLFIKN